MKNAKQITITDQGAEYLRKGQMWMYANNIHKLPDGLENGEVVNIITNANEYLGTGFVSLLSHITVKILAKDNDINIDNEFFYQLLEKSCSKRKEMMKENFNNCRLVFGEADGLPGLVIDRYNDILVSQISSFGMEKTKDVIYQMILEILNDDKQEITTIYERNDINIRKKEGLPLYKKPYLGNKTKTIINENGIYLNVDVENGQKTGYFLDQKDNRLLLRRMVKGQRILDCFCHTGGFGLNGKYGGASKVVCVDLSPVAINKAKENARLNKLDIDFVVADVFEYLDRCQRGEFDIIILDPPAFAKARKDVNKAYNGYKDINKRAMKLLDKGSYLISCSCSRYLEDELFKKMLSEAALAANVSFEIVSITYQSKDHPRSREIIESEYLKFYILKII